MKEDSSDSRFPLGKQPSSFRLSPTIQRALRLRLRPGYGLSEQFRNFFSFSPKAEK